MKRVPEGRGVSQALRALRVTIRRSLKGMNELAAQRMARGDYEAGETLARRGREIRQFLDEADTLRKRWLEIYRSKSGPLKDETTPLWAYYQPILRALVEIGGEGTRADLEFQVLQLMKHQLRSGDGASGSAARERWRVMVQRARKPLVSEGWIEAGAGKLWRITDAGRRAARESQPTVRKQ